MEQEASKAPQAGDGGTAEAAAAGPAAPGTASSRAPHPPQPWGAGPWPGQPASWAGGGLWQPEFWHTWLMRLGRGHGEARSVWIQSCSAFLEK